MFILKLSCYVVLGLLLTISGISIVTNTAQYLGILCTVLAIDFCAAFSSE